MQALGTLAGGVAHDFNNLLHSIQGYADLALSAVPRESVAADYIGELLKGSQRAASLVKQLLTFSRPSQERFVPLQFQIIIPGRMPATCIWRK